MRILKMKKSPAKQSQAGKKRSKKPKSLKKPATILYSVSMAPTPGSTATTNTGIQYDDTLDPLSVMLRIARLEKKITLRTFCQALKLNCVAYSQLERGIFDGKLDAQFVWDVAKYLELDPLMLLELAATYKPNEEKLQAEQELLAYLHDPDTNPAPGNTALLPIFMCRHE